MIHLLLFLRPLILHSELALRGIHCYELLNLWVPPEVFVCCEFVELHAVKDCPFLTYVHRLVLVGSLLSRPAVPNTVVFGVHHIFICFPSFLLLWPVVFDELPSLLMALVERE